MQIELDVDNPAGGTAKTTFGNVLQIRFKVDGIIAMRDAAAAAKGACFCAGAVRLAEPSLEALTGGQQSSRSPRSCFSNWPDFQPGTFST